MNPFDEPDAAFLVLRNALEQRSLWPGFAAVPSGWTVEFGPAPREDCRRHIEAAWTDIRPQRADLAR